MLLIKCWLIWFCLDGYWEWVSMILWRRRMLGHMYKSSVTCVSKIYMALSQGNKQSKKNKKCIAHQWVPPPERTCFPAKITNSWKDIKGELYAAELCAGGSCCSVTLGIGLHPSRDWSLDRDSSTFIMQQGPIVAVLDFLLFILDTSYFQRQQQQ